MGHFREASALKEKIGVRLVFSWRICYLLRLGYPESQGGSWF